MTESNTECGCPVLYDYSVIKGKLYLFGGSSDAQAKECLPGVYCFNIELLAWERMRTSGRSVRSLGHSAAAVGDNIYVFGGIVDGVPGDDLLMFNTVSLTWTPVKASGALPAARFNHALAVISEQLYVFGGCSEEGGYYSDVHVLNTETLAWQRLELKGDSPSGGARQTFTAHHDKARRMYVFGGTNEEQEFNDLKVMKLINPSERQPIMKEILSEFGIQGVSHAFAPTRVPNVKYELTAPHSPARTDSPPPVQTAGPRDFSAVRNEAMELINRAFAMLDNEFHKLDNERSELASGARDLQRERDAYSSQYQLQQQELQEMLERHKAQNEAWLRARAQENDRERKELCKLREEVLREQEKLKEEQNNVQKRSEQLLSIMQQFKGM
ncbi:RABEK protein, partial [Amia calva]|nr:RABEK protein [Amia calva]